MTELTTSPTQDETIGTGSPSVQGSFERPTTSPTEGGALTGAPTTDNLNGCDPIIPCTTRVFQGEGVVMCLSFGRNEVEVCVLKLIVQIGLEIGFCGRCPEESPSPAPTDAPSTVAPTVAATEAPSFAPTQTPTLTPSFMPSLALSEAPSAAPTNLEDICDPDPIIPCGEDSIYFCLTELQLGEFDYERTICLPQAFLPKAIDYGYCGECPPGPTPAPTTDPLEECDPIVSCDGDVNGITYVGVQFCIELDEYNIRTTICCPIRLVPAALAYGATS